MQETRTPNVVPVASESAECGTGRNVLGEEMSRSHASCLFRSDNAAYTCARSIHDAGRAVCHGGHSLGVKRVREVWLECQWECTPLSSSGCGSAPLLARVTALRAHPSQTPNGKMRHGPERSRRGEVSQSRKLPLQPQVRQRRLQFSARGAVGVGGRHALINCSQLARVSTRMVSNPECLSAECRTGGGSAAVPIGV